MSTAYLNLPSTVGNTAMTVPTSWWSAALSTISPIANFDIENSFWNQRRGMAERCQRRRAQREALLSHLKHIHGKTVSVNLAIHVGPKAVHAIALDISNGHQWPSRPQPNKIATPEHRRGLVLRVWRSRGGRGRGHSYCFRGDAIATNYGEA